MKAIKNNIILVCDHCLKELKIPRVCFDEETGFLRDSKLPKKIFKEALNWTIPLLNKFHEGMHAYIEKPASSMICLCSKCSKLLI